MIPSKTDDSIYCMAEIPQWFLWISPDFQNHHKASVFALDIPLIHFDYHSECRGGNYKNLEKLKGSLMKYLNNFEFFNSEGEETKKWVYFFGSQNWTMISNSTINFLNIWTPKKFVLITPKFEMWLYHSPNDADRMANSVDPDQTGVWSGSALFAQAYLSENLGSLRYLLKRIK